jgi:hypothetical protein
MRTTNLPNLTIATILVASISIAEFGNFGIVQGQGSSSNSTSSSSLPLYKQGYAKGLADAKSIQITTPPTGIMNPNNVDCDSDIEPHMNNSDYCLGYQIGYADTYNSRVAGK